MQIPVPVALTLTPLTSPDNDLLCGRTVEVDAIVENCRASRLTVVTSSPGLGASSLLRAGAEPALRREGFIAVIYDEWQGRSVAKEVRAAIVQAVRDQADAEFVPEPGPMLELLAEAQRKTGKPVAVLLDQFEDYVRCHWGTDISDEFDAELSNAISTRSGRFVIALQSLSITPFERLSQYVPNLMGFNIRLRPLTIDAGKDLVRRVMARADFDVEEAAVEALVTAPPASLHANEDHPAGVHPLFLRLATDCLIAAETTLDSKAARTSTLRANGGAERMTLESLDPFIRQLGRAQGELFCRWIPFLVSGDGNRTAVAEKALAGNAARGHRTALQLLSAMVDSGLLRTIKTRAGLRYEFTRESTTVIARDWLDRREAHTASRERVQLVILSIVFGAFAITVGYLIYRLVGRT